jgi:hypothetical protein
MIDRIKEGVLIARRNPRRMMKILLRRVGFSTDTGRRFGTDHEKKTLQKYAKASTIGIIEIGVLDGGTTREMALVARVPIYGIDPLIPDSMDEELIGNGDIIKKNLNFYRDFHFIKDFSYNTVKNFDKPFDFLWIDGDHSYEACKKDFADWFPLLSAGGFVAFHDSAPVVSTPSDHKGYAGPIRVVSELKNDSRVSYIETADSITIFQKAGQKQEVHA